MLHDDLVVSLKNNFRGWHSSNSASLGRTLLAATPRSGPLGETILNHIVSRNAVHIPSTPNAVQQYYRALVGTLLRPLTVRVRGSSTCVTTICTVDHHYEHSADYYSAEAFLLARASRKIEVDRGLDTTITRLPSTAEGFVSFCNPGDVAAAMRLAARKVYLGATDDYKDPKGRADAETQFRAALGRLLHKAQCT